MPAHRAGSRSPRRSGASGRRRSGSASRRSRRATRAASANVARMPPGTSSSRTSGPSSGQAARLEAGSAGTPRSSNCSRNSAAAACWRACTRRPPRRAGAPRSSRSRRARRARRAAWAPALSPPPRSRCASRRCCVALMSSARTSSWLAHPASSSGEPLTRCRDSHVDRGCNGCSRSRSRGAAAIAQTLRRAPGTPILRARAGVPQ